MNKYIHKTNTVFVDKFDRVCFASGKPIENPTILIDYEADIIHKYGNYESIAPMLPKYQQILNICDSEETAMLIQLDTTTLTSEQIAYIICRMVEFTATGFVKDFTDHITKPNVKQWLDSEMQRIQINVHES